MVDHQLDRQFQQERIQGCHQTSAGIDLHMPSKPPCGLYRIRQLFARYDRIVLRSEEQTSELQSLMRTSYAVFCLKKKNHQKDKTAFNPDTPSHQAQHSKQMNTTHTNTHLR